MTLPCNINPFSVPCSNIRPNPTHVLPEGHLHSVPTFLRTSDHLPPAPACPSEPSTASSQAHPSTSKATPLNSSPRPCPLPLRFWKTQGCPDSSFRFSATCHTQPSSAGSRRSPRWLQVTRPWARMGVRAGPGDAVFWGSSVLDKRPFWSRARSGEGVQGRGGGDGKFWGLG